MLHSIQMSLLALSAFSWHLAPVSAAKIVLEVKDSELHCTYAVTTNFPIPVVCQWPYSGTKMLCLCRLFCPTNGASQNLSEELLRPWRQKEGWQMMAVQSSIIQIMALLTSGRRLKWNLLALPNVSLPLSKRAFYMS